MSLSVDHSPARRPTATVAVALAGAAAAIAVGLLATSSPVVAIALALALAVVGTSAILGIGAVVGASVVLLPWLVVLDAQIPALVRTAISAGLCVSLLVHAAPLTFREPLVTAGATLFLASLLIVLAQSADGAQLQQAAKYVLFPLTAFAVSQTDESGRSRATAFIRPALASCAGALAVHVVLIAAGIGDIGTRYGAGERLGFAGSVSHELGLLAVVVAASSLALVRDPRHQIVLLSLAGVTVVASGIRAAWVALAIVVLIHLVRSRFAPRQTFAVLLLGVVIALSGVGSVVTERFALGEQRGEYQSFSAAGSGRGSIWTVALEGYRDAGPVAWVTGTGLRSIQDFSQQALGQRFVGHSDILEVGIQMGIVGLVGWLLIWLGLLRAGFDPYIIVAVLVFGIVNGAIEAVGPMMLALVLASGGTLRRRDPGRSR